MTLAHLTASPCAPLPPPRSWEYLVKPSRQAWLDCATNGYYSDICGDVINPSAYDFPRSIQVGVAAQRAAGVSAV